MTLDLKALENQGWCVAEQVYSDEFCSQVVTHLNELLAQAEFHSAAVGKKLDKTVDKSIRKSEICWIDHWQAIDELSLLKRDLEHIMDEVKNYFLLSLKRFESQFAVYPIGGYYKKHLDQLRKSPHRQLSHILYLNDCNEGGELVLYDRNNKLKIAQVIRPKKGQCVAFLSAQIYHEVLPVKDKRLSITTWFRDDEICPLV